MAGSVLVRFEPKAMRQAQERILAEIERKSSSGEPKIGSVDKRAKNLS
jgi:hypothetical protein